MRLASSRVPTDHPPACGRSPGWPAGALVLKSSGKIAELEVLAYKELAEQQVGGELGVVQALLAG